jgi:hypothetical protein
MLENGEGADDEATCLPKSDAPLNAVNGPPESDA